MSKDRCLTVRNGTFYARLWIGGREIRRSLSTASRTVALKRLAELRQELAAAPAKEAQQANRVSYADAVVQWDVTYLQSGSLKPRSAQSYRDRLAGLHPIFGHLYLDQIDKKAVAAYVAQRRRDGVTNATIRRGLTALSSILTFAGAMGWTDTNAAREWDRRVIRETRPPRQRRINQRDPFHPAQTHNAPPKKTAMPTQADMAAVNREESFVASGGTSCGPPRPPTVWCLWAGTAPPAMLKKARPNISRRAAPVIVAKGKAAPAPRRANQIARLVPWVKTGAIIPPPNLAAHHAPRAGYPKPASSPRSAPWRWPQPAPPRQG